MLRVFCLAGPIRADADLDVLGREDFMARNRALRAELAAYGQTTTDGQWHKSQLEFIQNHCYFTAAARALRDAQKQKNIAALRELIDRFNSQVRGGD
jgi:hypothetical protein